MATHKRDAHLTKNNPGNTSAEVTIPYEFLPLPKVGQRVWALNREGKVVGRARVSKVRSSESFDRTALVSFEIKQALANEVRHFTIRKPQFLKTRPVRASGANKARGTALEEALICRCEEVRRGEITAAIADGNHTFDDLKRTLRCGMGSCQGKGCQPLVLDMLAKHSGRPRGEFLPATMRPPTRPTLLRILAASEPSRDRKGAAFRESPLERGVPPAGGTGCVGGSVPRGHTPKSPLDRGDFREPSRDRKGAVKMDN